MIDAEDPAVRRTRLYALAYLRYQRRHAKRLERLRRMEAGDGPLWPWPEWACADLTHEAWLLCRRLNDPAGQPEMREVRA